MDRIPLEVFYRIREYLAYLNYVFLLNTSKKIFADIKKKTVYYSLNAELSSQFLFNKEFKEILLSKIEDKSKQMGLIFPEYFENLKLIGKVKKLTLSRALTMTPSAFASHFSNIPFLKLCYNYNMTSLEGLSDEVLKLHLFDFTKLNDISNFGHLKACKLVNCNNIKDVQSLSKLLKLTLSKCPEITDISCLGNLQQLELIRCSGIRSVANLGNIHEIKIDECKNILSIQELTKNKKVSIFRMDHLQDFSSFNNSQELNFLLNEVPQKYFQDFHYFLECRSLKLTKYFLDFPSFSMKSSSSSDLLDELFYSSSLLSSDTSSSSNCKLQRLILHDCTWGRYGTHFCLPYHQLNQLQYLELVSCERLGNTALSSFLQIPVLKIVDCAEITSLDGLSLESYRKNILQKKTNEKDPVRSDSSEAGSRKIQQITISQCLNIYNFEPINYIPTITIESCMNFLSAKQLANAHSLTISNCRGIKDISMLGKVHTLKIISCFNITSLKGLSDVYSLTILYCYGINDIQDLGNNYKLCFPCFPNIMNLSLLQEKYSQEETKNYLIFLRKNEFPLDPY